MRKIIDQIEISKIRSIAIKTKQIPDSINFTIGEPGQDVPQGIKEEMVERILGKNKIGYAPAGGVPELRKAIANFYNKYFEGDYNERECYITVGATEALSTFIRSIVEPGDEVILPLPTYPGYEPNVLLEGGKCVFIDTKPTGFKVTAEEIEAHITDKTKAIIITYPNNPTGLSLSEEEMDKIADLLRRHKNIYMMCDEIYASLTFDKFHSLAKYHDLKDRAVVISGFSKSHNMTGYRVGYMLSNEENIKKFLKVSQYGTTGVTTVSQYGALKAINDYPLRTETIKQNKERMDYFIKGLRKLGFTVIEPEGAFYVFASYEKLSDMDSLSLCMDILDKVHVGIVPGICFNTEGYMRFSVTVDAPKLDEALERLEKYFKEVK